MKRELRDSVIVVVGATSGVGRATAQALARRQAILVLAARDELALHQVVEECRAVGATALAVAADLSRPADLEHLADYTAARFGRIDTWINVAAALVAGPLDQVPEDELSELVQVNVTGTLLASRAAIARFRRQGRGVLINCSSLLGVVPNPVVPAYTMSKFAIRGLTLALHHDPHLKPGIRCCVVLPGPMDTPMFARAANHTGRRLRAVPPSCAPERAAAAIVSLARRPRRQVVVGWTGRLALLGSRVLPAFTEWAVSAYSGRLVVGPWPAPDTAGDLFTSSGLHPVDGGWRHLAVRRRLGASVGRLRSRLA